MPPSAEETGGGGRREPMSKTSKIDDKLLLESIWKGYCTALGMVEEPGFSDKKRGRGNRLLSARFVAEVSNNIHRELFGGKYDLNVIEVHDNGEKESGEWLVDACITEGKKRKEFIRRIIFAMESESGVDRQAFNEDFAKLVHIKASHKLYLNGLNHKTRQGAEDYIKKRLEYAEQFLNEEDADTFHFGFWPSPGKLVNESRPSAWKQLKKFKHLDQIHLYKFTQGNFKPVQEEKK